MSSKNDETLPSGGSKPSSSRSAASIIVARQFHFPLTHWRDALQTLIDGIRNKSAVVLKAPEIQFGRVYLRWNREGDYFIAFGEPTIAPPDPKQHLVHNGLVRADDDRERVLRSLELLMARNDITHFAMHDAHQGQFWLWKTRSTIRASVANVPRMVVF